jgi:ADP-ribose pyrophosphatase
MKVEIIKNTRVFDGFFKIDEAVLKHEKFNGQMSAEIKRLCFERGSSVAVLLYQSDPAQVWLTRQFRYPAHVFDPRPYHDRGWVLETIAGMVGKNELPIDCAEREVFEESGFKLTGALYYISSFFVSPGGSSEYIYLYAAPVTLKDKKNDGGGVVTENEDIKIENFSLTEALNMARQGEICDAKTIIALQWLEKQLILKRAL